MRCCPKCGRDYSEDPFWTTSLKRHLERKKPCVNVTIPDMNTFDSLELPSVTLGERHQNVGPRFFIETFAHQPNVCFVRQNKSKNEILVKVSRDDIRVVTMDEFIKLFVVHVLMKVGLKYSGFDCWLFSDNGIDLDTGEYDPHPKNEFFKHLKPVITSFLDTFPSKTLLKNKLVLK